MFIKSIYKVECTQTMMASTFPQVSVYQHIFLQKYPENLELISERKTEQIR